MSSVSFSSSHVSFSPAPSTPVCGFATRNTTNKSNASAPAHIVAMAVFASADETIKTRAITITDAHMMREFLDMVSVTAMNIIFTLLQGYHLIIEIRVDRGTKTATSTIQ